MLFDCGSIKSGAGFGSIRDVVQQVIKDAREMPGDVAKIDIVVATHRHRDHISGFADPAWADVEVGEVWMPWTEEPQDNSARQIRANQNRLATLLALQLETRLNAAQDEAERQRIAGFHEMVLNALSNEDAMRTLQRGFAGNPVRRYLPQTDVNISWIETPLLPSLTINVLGPSRDPDVIRELDPPAGQSYLRLAASQESYSANVPRPFGIEWHVTTEDYQNFYTPLSSLLADNDRTRIRNSGLGLDEAVSAALDKALNGTSLMLCIQIGAAVLLFPGDAQWGTWRQALINPEFRKLLAQTTFYKVGHHGSHNATPVEFVDQVIKQGFWAMVSTNSVAQWPKIPKQELIEALNKKTQKFARSDQPTAAKAPYFISVGDGVIEAKIPF